ncbi:hypothetical protein I7I50_08532 [Histoplasma capsulatum G186AR]|uniref:Uncharacterized protein n=1 Tax=Ajellomyces capsulatus TaxID=5037 RepID=A0A8H7YQZ8_AJECA|nr:hypothetical protein I7I52_06047 [Histoplasma capsulatum]QSS73667.1 hypothetical protein I7I50_08532 [Histoplasma capsulatum G186AR]
MECRIQVPRNPHRGASKDMGRRRFVSVSEDTISSLSLTTKLEFFENDYSWFEPTRTRHRQHDSILYTNRYTFKPVLQKRPQPNPHILLEFPFIPTSIPGPARIPKTCTSLTIFETLTHATDPATGFADSQAHRFCSINPSSSAKLCRASALLRLSRLCKRPSCSA